MEITKRAAIALAAVLALSYATAARGQIDVELLGGGLDDLVGLTHAGDGSGRLFVVSKLGTIHIWDGAQVVPTPFLDIQEKVLVDVERGLIGLAFHPDYETNGRFFVHYTAIPNGATTLAEYSVDPFDPNLADPASEVIRFSAFQPFAVHNGGQLAFGPNDGFLYMAVGDGGSFLDEADNGQDLSDVLGNILRFDVDIPAPYIPPTNPFVGVPGARDEIWVYGLRNPWRFSFDRATGDMFIGDVGENTTEEIDFVSASSPGGENFGWNRMEGSGCFDPPVDCDDGSFTHPIMEYLHIDDGNFLGCAVMAGYRYRGSAYPELTGQYFFGDFCTGVIWSGTDQGGGAWAYEEAIDTTIGITSFGEDEAGELYVVGFNNFFRIVGTGTPVTCTLAPGQPVYVPGDELVLSMMEVANEGTNVEAIRVEIGILRGGSPPVRVFDVGSDGSLTINPGQVADAAPLSLGTIPIIAPPGTYEIGCRITDPATGELLVSERVPFDLQ